MTDARRIGDVVQGLDEQLPRERRGGRPVAYTPDLADYVLLQLMEGRSLRSICNDAGMPARSTVHLWLDRNTEGFSDRYARARQVQAAHYADELIEIADQPLVGIRRKRKTFAADPKRRGNPDAIDDDGEIMDPPAMVTEEEEVEADNVERSRLMVDTRKWVVSKILHRQYGQRVDVNHGVQTSLAQLIAMSGIPVPGVSLPPALAAPTILTSDGDDAGEPVDE